MAPSGELQTLTRCAHREAPLLTDRRKVLRWPTNTPEDDVLAVEEPLEIRVEGRPLAVTLRTPGHDLDLAAGFLLTEGIIDGLDDLQALAHALPAKGQNTVDVRLAGGVAAHTEALDRARREIYANSSCGVCGKASLDRLFVSAQPHPRFLQLSSARVTQLPELLRQAQQGWRSTGGLHAAMLVDAHNRVLVLREDVGRHNAVDKVLGSRLRADAPLDDQLLVVSSRVGFEVVQKALVAGVRAVVALGAASTLAVDLAQRGRLTLIGFARPDRFTRYCP